MSRVPARCAAAVAGGDARDGAGLVHAEQATVHACYRQLLRKSALSAVFNIFYRPIFGLTFYKNCQ